MSILSTEFIQTSIRVVNVTNEIRGAHVMSLTATWIKVMYRTQCYTAPRFVSPVQYANGITPQ